MVEHYAKVNDNLSDHQTLFHIFTPVMRLERVSFVTINSNSVKSSMEGVSDGRALCQSKWQLKRPSLPMRNRRYATTDSSCWNCDKEYRNGYTGRTQFPFPPFLTRLVSCSDKRTSNVPPICTTLYPVSLPSPSYEGKRNVHLPLKKFFLDFSYNSELLSIDVATTHWKENVKNSQEETVSSSLSASCLCL